MAKTPFLHRRIDRGKPFTDPEAERGRDRTASFYVARSDTILFNAFLRFLVYRNEKISLGVMRAIRFFLSHLDPEDEAIFKASLKDEAVKMAEEVNDVKQFADQLLREGDSIEKILKDRSHGSLKRREELQAKAREFFESR